MDDKLDGKLLRVNLTNKECTVEKIPYEERLNFLGGRGLGALLLYRELEPGTEPLGESNKLIFATGPLTGTNAPGSSKYVVLTKSPLTNIYLMSVSSRQLGSALRKAGFDILMIEGVAQDTSYLYIDDEKVEIRRADGLKGKDTYTTEEILRDELGKHFQVACIGPAGENQVLYACICNDRRTAGRGGAGAVMGSKNLKAIAIRGTGSVKIADVENFREAVKQATLQCATSPNIKSLSKYGTGGLVDSMNHLGISPVRNWQHTGMDVSKLTSEYMLDKHFVKDLRCAPCPVACSKLNKVFTPEGELLVEGPEYETLYSFGTCLEINDFNTVAHADYLCDKYGLDTISAGVSIAFVMECFEKGILGPDDTGGLDIRFGNKDIIEQLIVDISQRRGFGDFLAQGTRKMSEELGRNSEYFAMHVKGMEMGGYDPRASKGMATNYACGPRGGCHHAGGRTVGEEVQKNNRFEEKGKGIVTKMQRERRALCDSAIICTFQVIPDETVARLLSAALGQDYDFESLLKVGERISNLERLYNIREGISPRDDTLPGRLLKESLPQGPAKGHAIEDFNAMLQEFYEECEWDLEDGKPSLNKIKELGLDSFISL